MMPLDYPLTRSFPGHWRWFSLVSITGAVIAIIVLGVVNTALTGYETVTVFQSNFNATQTHWYDRFMPFRVQKPGTLCDSHVFNVGDPFTTNYTFFQWNVDSIVQPNAGESGVSYSGAPLTSCDVASVYLDGSLLSWSLDFTVITNCTDSSWNVTARTSFSMSFLPGRFSPLLGVERYLNDGTRDIRGAVLNNLLVAASRDLGYRTYNALTLSNRSSPIDVSVQANFNYCPLSLGLNAPCANNPPQFDIRAATVVYPNSTYRTYDNSLAIDPTTNPLVLDDDTQLAIYNLLQTVYASIRMDLGNPSPNNFILNHTALNGTIAPTFPLTGTNGEASSNSILYQYAISIATSQPLSDLTVSGPATIQVVYPCQFQQRKSFGQLVISVLVATLSMFSSGWAVFISMATAFAKRNNPTANRCNGHHFLHRPEIGSTSFEASETYGLQTPESKRTFSDTKKKFLGAVYQPVTSDTGVHSTSGHQVNIP